MYHEEVRSCGWTAHLSTLTRSTPVGRSDGIEVPNARSVICLFWRTGAPYDRSSWTTQFMKLITISPSILSESVSVRCKPCGLVTLAARRIQP